MPDARARERVEGAEGGEQLVGAAEVEESGFDAVGFAGFFEPEGVGDGALGDCEAVLGG